MPMREITGLFEPTLQYFKIDEPSCDGRLTWFAKPGWQDLIEHAVGTNNYLHRLEELARTAGIGDSNADLMLRMRCQMCISMMQFVKGGQECKSVCTEYENQSAFVSRRVACDEDGDGDVAFTAPPVGPGDPSFSPFPFPDI